MTTKMVAVALQGGGALGAYELGVLKALYEQSGFEPRVVTGVSIGAINAAVLAGARGHPIEALEELWRRLAVIDLPFLPLVTQRLMSLMGNGSMYTPRVEFPMAPLVNTSIYDTAPLRHVLEELVDFDRLNAGSPWVKMTAVDIERGELVEFQNRMGHRIETEHIIASGSLPPGFPMTRIEKGVFWDGGLFSSTPLAPAIGCLEAMDDIPGETVRELITVELFPKRSKRPGNMMEVIDRMLELCFINKLELDEKLFEKKNAYIDLARALDEELPRDSAIRALQGFKDLLEHKRIDRFTVIRHTEPQVLTAPFDFSKSSIERRIRAGYDDARKHLSEP